LTSMRIARVIPHFYPFVTGPANQAFKVSKRLVERGMEVCIFTSNFGAQSSPDHETIDGVEIRRIPISRTFMQYFVTPSLMSQITSFNPDIVHAHDYRSYQTESAYNYCQKNKTPLIISLHGTGLGYKYSSTGLLGRIPYVMYDKLRGLKQLRSAAAVIVNSSREESEAKELIRKDSIKIVRIPMGYETHSLGLSRDEHSVLMVERVTIDRDPRPLIKAIQKAKASFPDIRFKIVGREVANSSSAKKGIVQSAKEMVRDLDLSNNVFFLGELHGDALESEYRLADVFVYNSRYENFGQPILEAASYGLPIIATNVGIVSDLIEDGVNGLIVERVNDADAFAEKIIFLLANANLRREMGKRIRNKVDRLFNWESVISKYTALYQQIETKDAS
jgi:glycosyltransferase involved in cell wall biosynthesis